MGPDLVAMAGRALDALRSVEEYLTAVLNETGGDNLPAVYVTAHGLLDRVTCWIVTLRKLDQTAHYQAYLTAARSMIELTADLVLLEGDPALNEKLEAWEESAKYKAAKAALDYTAGGAKIRMPLTDARAYVAQRAATIDHMRAKHWPAASTKNPNKKAKHPGRWTGNALIDDVRAVDKLCPNADLERLHVELYNYSCMVVHGSAIAATRNGGGGMAVLPAMGMALLACGTHALLCAEFTLRIMGRFDSEQESRLADVAIAWSRGAVG